jgi:hypothetical protein
MTKRQLNRTKRSGKKRRTTRKLRGGQGSFKKYTTYGRNCQTDSECYVEKADPQLMCVKEGKLRFGTCQ